MTSSSFRFLFSFSLLLITFSLSAQNFVAADSIVLKTKDKVLSFSEPDANYIIIKEKSNIRLVRYDTAFKRQYIATKYLDDLLNSKVMLGATSTGNVITILFSSKYYKHFSTLLFDPRTRQFISGVNFDIDDYVYLNWFPQGNKMNIIAVKKGTSILSVVGLDSIGPISKTTFDLSHENFGSTIQRNLSDVLAESHYNNASLVNNLTLKKILPGTYHSDLDPDDLCKMYYTDNEVYITLNVNSSSFTQVEKLDMTKGTYTNYSIPFARNNVQPGEYCDRSSFLCGHQLFTAFIYRKGLSIGVYDLDSLKYIRQWGPDPVSLDSIRDSPLVFEKISNTTTMNLYEITKGKLDTMETWEKFQKKMFSMPILSIAANKTENGNIDICVGGLMVIEKNSGMGMGAPMMMGGMGGGAPMMMGGPSLGSMDPASFYDEDQPKARRHCFFKCTLTGGTYAKTAESMESRLYRKFQVKYMERLDTGDEQNFSKFNKGNRFYLGFYLPEQSQYIITEYK